MTYIQRIALRGKWVTCVLLVALTVPSFAQSEAKPEPATLQKPAWMRDIQSFDNELRALVSKAKVPSQEEPAGGEIQRETRSSEDFRHSDRRHFLL